VSTDKKMHLCGLLTGGPVVSSHAVWRNPYSDGDFLSLDYYTEAALAMERGKFDLLFFADRLGIADRFRNSHETGVRHADQDVTRLDPLPILGAMAAVTKHIGLGATRSTTYDLPYHIAREFRTLDHLSKGRAAWNVVTSMNDGEAMNFGAASHLPHDERYDRADEFLEVVLGLWDSWEPDALIRDKVAGIYADPSKVKYLNHDGKYLRCRGPLNIPSSPQHRPVIIQAGSSGRGKTFAARWAEVIFNVSPDIEATRRFSADVRQEIEKNGGSADRCKVLSAAMTFVADSASEAQEKMERHNSLVHPLVALSTLSSHANIDIGAYDLTAPLEKINSTGSQGNIANITKIAKDQSLTLMEVGSVYGRSIAIPQYCGTGKQVAEILAEHFKSGACDGYVLSPSFVPEMFTDFTDLVVPHLQKMGVYRQEYRAGTLRDNLAD
jgi:FMN-dependent oxidoreductase (nitrilotriacetate monooxygenase family)